ncbi:MAG: hypothetical protein GY719_13375 [bacterium]|nr:hypothetical protein [bacterium]
MKKHAWYGFVAILLLAGTTTPASAAGFSTIVGSWQALSTLDTGEEAPGLFTFSIDRTWISTGNDAAFSNGHGAWKRTGPRTFTAKNKAFILDEAGGVSLVLTNHTDLEVSADGKSFTAVFTTEVSLLDGTVIDSFSGTSTGTRITAN